MNSEDIIGNLIKRLHIVATVEGDTAVDSARTAKGLGADMIEVRLDRIPDIRQEGQAADVISRIRQAVPLPIIGTVRSPSEQEGAVLPRLQDAERMKIYGQIIPLVDMVDTEINSSSINQAVIQQAHGMGKLVILSYHDFMKTPDTDELMQQGRRALDLGADLVKIAVMAKGIEDVRRLMVFCQSWQGCPIIALSLGFIGSISRLAGFVFGSCLTYGYIDKPVGPGQLSLKLLVESRRLYYRA